MTRDDSRGKPLACTTFSDAPTEGSQFQKQKSTRKSEANTRGSHCRKMRMWQPGTQANLDSRIYAKAADDKGWKKKKSVKSDAEVSCQCKEDQKKRPLREPDGTVSLEDPVKDEERLWSSQNKVRQLHRWQWQDFWTPLKNFLV